MYGIIYKATNKSTGKVYIGQTVLSLRIRINTHFTSHGKRRPTYFESALHKYGRDAFSWEQIDSAENQEALNAKEREWIAFYDSTDRRKGYNTNPGGRNYGRMAETTKQKISKTRMGYPGTMNGVKHTAEARKKISKAKLGKKRKPFTLIARIHMGDVRKGKPWTPARREAERKRQEIERGVKEAAEERELVG